MRSAVRLIERCLWAIGFLAAGVWLIIWLNARWWQAEGNRELERRLSETASSSTAPSSNVPPSSSSGRARGDATHARLADGDLIGRIEIPRLDVSSVIFEGDDDGVLSMGVGHLPGSPLPGEAGNVVLAAHRDTFFRALRYIRNRDRIDVITPSGTRHYQVEATSIVTPDHTEVLAATRGATLTLVTCYPFDWFGHAPKRFIVRAHALDSRDSRDALTASSQPAKIAAGAAGVMANVYAQPDVRHVDAVPSGAASPARRTWQAIADRPKTASPDVTDTPRDVPSPIEKSDAPSPIANKRIASRRAASAQEPSDDTAPQAESAATAKPSGNRFLRGLKKLNPAPALARLAGN